MKKAGKKRRCRDVKNSIENRRCGRKKLRNAKSRDENSLVDPWFNKKRLRDLNIFIDGKNRATLVLPDKMDFSRNYDKTLLHLMAVRMLVAAGAKPPGSIRLRRVSFNELRFISTSAALVLAAELSRWESSIRLNLNPNTETWDREIYHQLYDLGFFELFEKDVDSPEVTTTTPTGPNLVKYIKGGVRDHSKPRLLQERLREVVGNDIDKWAFLHSGVVEAIINVAHHAYPEGCGVLEQDRNWYLSGSYNTSTRQLKIVFYDQGIGIPNSLPATTWGEKILSFAASLGVGTALNDAGLLEAAFAIDRSRTEQEDRGKGLQDMLEFVRQRHQGYLAVVSGHGAYRVDIEGEKERFDTIRLREELKGTLIVWSATLEHPGLKI